MKLVTRDEEGHSVVSDNPKYHQYKCRGNYIVSLRGTLQAAVKDGAIVDPSLIEKIEKFDRYDFKHYHGEFTTQQEIDMINQILADVIQYLEGQE